MSHLKHKPSRSTDLIGDFSVDDYGVFLRGGQLSHLSAYWDAVVAQSILLDESIGRSIAAHSVSSQVQDADSFVVSANRIKTLELAEACLVKASIFCLLCAYLEFAILEIYRLVFGGSPVIDRPRLEPDLIAPLKARLIIVELPEAYKTHVVNHRDVIRNAFVHGRWGQLNDPLTRLDLHDAFIGVAACLAEVEKHLVERGFEP
jgi:hypothetical protein